MNETKYRAAETQYWAHYQLAPTERWLELRAPSTRVRIQELGQGPPLLFLHGGPAAGTIFAPLASQLRDYRCILLDRPGCGLSPWTGRYDAPLDEWMATFVCSVLDALELESVPIVASSFGGACAIWTLLRHPERISCIAYMGCPAFVSQMEVPFIMKLLATPTLGYLAARLPMNRSGVLSFMKTMGQHQAIAKGLLPDAFVQWWIALANETETMKCERELIRHGLTWKGMRPELVISDECFQGIQHPSYLYWGEDDPFATVEFIKQLAADMPQLRLDVLAQSGHLPWFDRPQDAAERTRTFLHQHAT